MRLFLITYLLYFLFPIISIGQYSNEKTLALRGVFLVGSDSCIEFNVQYLESMISDSVEFNYKSTQDSSMFTDRYILVHDSIGSFFVKNGTKIFLFNAHSMADSLLYENILSNIKLKLKGSGPKRMYFGGPPLYVEISFLVNNEGRILEKGIDFYDIDFPKIRRKFMQSNFTFTPWLLKGESRNVLYFFSLSPYDIN